MPNRLNVISPLIGLIKARQRHLRRDRMLRMCAVRDLSLPTGRFDVEYSLPFEGGEFRETAGVYVLEDLVLEKVTGRLFIKPSDAASGAFWPICINESSLDDHQSLFANSKRFSAPNIPDKLPLRSYERPVIVLNITKKKRNYYHFMAENAPQLIAVLEHGPQPVDILVESNQPSFINGFLEIVARTYDARIHYFEPRGHERITSPVVIVEDIVKRHFGQFSLNARLQREQIQREGQAKTNGFSVPSTISPVYSEHVSPRFWNLTIDGIQRRAKNNNLQILPSKTGIGLFRRFVNNVLSNEPAALASAPVPIRVITRQGESGRGRNIANEAALVEAFPEAQFIRYGELALIEQMRATRATKVLIGLHGAGLTNMLFLQEGGHVIEIAPVRQSIPASNLFENLAHLCGLGYSRVSASELDASLECTLSREAIQRISALAREHAA